MVECVVLQTLGPNTSTAVWGYSYIIYIISSLYHPIYLNHLYLYIRMYIYVCGLSLYIERVREGELLEGIDRDSVGKSWGERMRNR